MLPRIGLNDRPLLERLDSGINRFDVPPQLSPFFAPPPAPAPFQPPTSPADAAFQGPPQKTSLRAALKVISAAVADVMGEDTDFYWRWDSFQSELAGLIATKRDAKKEALRAQITETIAEGRSINVEIGDLETRHRRTMMEWNAGEAVASQKRSALAAVSMADPAAHDEFYSESEREQWRSAVAVVQAEVDDAERKASATLQTMHSLEEAVTAAKRKLDPIRARLRSLREDLGDLGG